MYLITILSFAILGGVIPSLLWLLFWLKEDDKNPEPKNIIFRTFIYGMLSVPLVLIVQWFVNIFILGGEDVGVMFILNYFLAVLALGSWAFAEELFKYYGAKFGALKSKANDEPVDPMIYMITAALGFTALENTLFLVNSLIHANPEVAILTGSMRFIGATLLHVASSGIIGAFISFSYYKNKILKFRFLLIGLALATILHTVFNSFIIRGEYWGGMFNVIGFTMVWIVIIILILVFEKVKKLKFMI